MAFWDGQAGAFKDAGRAGGGRHARPRRGRAACGVGRSGRIEGEVGRRGVLWQEKSWAGVVLTTITLPHASFGPLKIAI